MSAKWQTTEQAAMARRLLRGIDSGILATMSQELPGYPFGSVTPYAMTHEGRVAVFVSGIAQHTRNMRGDPKVCLTVIEQATGAENQQALGRVTVVGDASAVPADREDAVRERYFGFFPEARHYSQTHDFHLYWLEPRRVRFIRGFGQIFWVEAEEWSVPTPEWSAGEAGIVEHMNSDHGDSVLEIARRQVAEVEEAELVAVDPEGFHVRADSRLLYIAFPEPCLTSAEVRAGMVQLARAIA